MIRTEMMRGVSATRCCSAFIVIFCILPARARQRSQPLTLAARGVRRQPAHWRRAMRRRALPPLREGRPYAALHGFAFPSEPKSPEQGYVVTNTSTGLKLDIPIKATPASIVVVPKRVFQDQNHSPPERSVRNLSGVQSNNNDAEGYIFYVRGFRNTFLFRNAVSFYGDDAQGVEDIGEC